MLSSFIVNRILVCAGLSPVLTLLINNSELTPTLVLNLASYNFAGKKDCRNHAF